MRNLVLIVYLTIFIIYPIIVSLIIEEHKSKYRNGKLTNALFFLAIFNVILSLLIIPTFSPKTKFTYTNDIICINNTSKIYNKTRYIIHQDEVYKYYIKNKDNSCEYREVSASKSKIYQDNQSYVIVYYYKYNNPIIEYLYGGNKKFLENPTYEFHIPEGSIEEYYNISNIS